MRLYRPNFLMKSRRLRGIMRMVTFLVLAVTVLGAVIVFISESSLKTASLEIEHRNRQTWTNDYLSFTKFQSQVAESMFRRLIQEADIGSLLDAYLATDSDAERLAVRERLQKACIPFYSQAKSDGLDHLHFHTPNSISILRMDHPEMYGDALGNQRSTITKANASRHSASGFERGRSFLGFRWVWPVFHSGKHVGSVELGYSPDRLITFMTETFPGRHYMIQGYPVGQMVAPDDAGTNPSMPDILPLAGFDIDLKSRDWNIGKSLTIQRISGKDGYYFLYLQPILDLNRETVATLTAIEPDFSIGHVEEIRSHMVNLGWLGVVFVGCLTGLILFLSSSVKHQDLDQLIRIEKLLSNLPGMLCQWQYYPRTGTFSIPFTSSGIQTLFGLAPEDVREDASRILSKIHPEDVTEMTTSMKQSAASGNSWFFECRVCQDGEQDQWRQIVGTPDIHRDGSIIWHSYIRDITDRKKEQEALEHANRMLEMATEKAQSMAAMAEDSNSAKSEFLAHMSHDIRTPLNGVLGLTEVLLETNLEEEQRLFVRTIQNSAEALKELINDILDISKIEAGKLEIEHIDFSISELMDDFAIPTTVECQRKDLDFIYSIDLNVGDALKGDPNRLRQILNNLCGNAIKFTSVGHVVTRVSRVEESDQDILLKFSVVDSGIGIPEDKQDLLFKDFSQLDPSISRKYGGTGLGLAISKQLSSLMGGDVGFASVEGRGSEFWFTARLAKQEKYTAPGDLRIPLLEGTRVLVSIRSIPARQVLKTWLNAFGLEARFIENGLSVIEELRSFTDGEIPYKLVIDEHMAGDKELATMSRFFESKWSEPGVNFLLITPLSGKFRKKSDFPKNNVDWISKPLNLEKVRVAICSLFHTE